MSTLPNPVPIRLSFAGGALLAVFGLAHTASAADATPPYLNPQLPIEQRIDDLLPRMTIDEKISQISDDWGSRGIDRLKVPPLLKTEGLHGQSYATGSTIFPHAINMASSFDLASVGEIGKQTAVESKAAGIRGSWSPVLDVARDVRWGRVEETYGESPYLVSRMGVSWIEAFQGEGMMAVPKHFAGHGQPVGGRDSNDYGLSDRTMEEIHLPSFRAAIEEAHAHGIMAAYGVWDGVPDNASTTLLQKILRQEWGFDGEVVSDCSGIEHFVRKHAIVQTVAEAAAIGIRAGVNMECGQAYRTGLADALAQGLVTEAEVDATLRPSLRNKFRLGLFEHPGSSNMNWNTLPEYNTPASRALARKVAVEGSVLLKNDNNLLPLNKNIRTIAVIGPNADHAQTGDYSAKSTPGQLVTVLTGIKNHVSAGTHVIYAEGLPSQVSTDTSKFAEAVAAAKQADVVVLVVGDRSANIPNGGESTTGENRDGATLDFPGAQRELIKAVYAAGKPVVLVLVNGKPITLAWEADNIPAILVTWYPGQEGGNATADLLFGDANPSGHLPVTWPRHPGQLPLNYDYYTSGRRYDYYDMPATPQYRFGYGLSYTQFRYSNIQITPKADNPGYVTVTADIENTGNRDGDEVAQLYITDCFASVRTRVCDLQGFQRVSLKKGEKKTVSFQLTPYQLSLLDPDMIRRVEVGAFRIHVGGVCPALSNGNDDAKARIGYANANEGVTGEFTETRAYAADFNYTLEAPARAGSGEPFPVKVTVTNNGNLTDVTTVKLFSNFELGEWSFELNPGETKTHTFTPTIYKAGDLNLIAGKQMISRPIDVQASPARIEFKGTRIRVDDNGTLQITAEARNVGGALYEGSLTLKVDGQVSGTPQPLKLDSGEARKVILTHTFSVGGLHRIQINDLSEQQIVVNSGLALAVKSPLIYLKLNEGHGASVKNEITGQALHVRGNPVWVDGRATGSKALQLADSGLGIEAGNADIYRKSFTLSAWVKINKLSPKNQIALFGGQAPMGADQDTTGTVLHAGVDGKKMKLGFFGSDIGGGKEVPLNTWVNLTYTYDMSEKKGNLYLNGVLDKSSKQKPYTGPLEIIGDAPILTHGDYALGEVFVAQSCMPSALIRHLVANGPGGLCSTSYTSDWRSLSGPANSIVIASEIPQGTSIKVTVDVGSQDGKTLGSTSAITLRPGTQTYPLSGLPAGAQIRIRVSMETTQLGVTPVLRAATVAGQVWSTANDWDKGQHGSATLVTDFGQP
ncbi:MAG TPA: glycoside hydrolase family 3 C-terminal domain-containing protein [Rariglobus sp.]|nr:glycoside hydrolase family 3 C-terminal domain-containing protein [Rariglobus sp.]